MLKLNKRKAFLILFCASATLCIVIAAQLVFRSETFSKPGHMLTLIANLLLMIGTGLSYREQNKRLKTQRENGQQ